MILVRQGLNDEGVAVPMTKLCKWFGVTSNDALQADQSFSQGQSRAI